MTKKKTRAELAAEVKILRERNHHDGAWGAVQTLIRWGGLAFIAWCAWGAVDSLAGKNTVADIAVGLITDIKFVSSIALGGGGVVYGLQQRKLRQSKTETLQERIKTLETAIDNNRSGSKITTRGKTNPEDL